MKHCLKQREKLKNKFTFVTKGLDGPWKNDEVTIRFCKETKRKNNYQKCYSRVSMWGTDDFGMELRDASEQDYHTMLNLCTNVTPSIDYLKKMKYEIV